MAQPEQGTGAIAPDETVSCFQKRNVGLAFSSLTFTSLAMLILLLYVHNFQVFQDALKLITSLSFKDEEINSTTSSIASSIFKFRKEHGRTYNAYGERSMNFLILLLR
jgi:hypothetical protein